MSNCEIRKVNIMKAKKNYIIYKAQNELTGATYFGATSNSIHQRKLDHTERALRGEKGCFHQQIATYGAGAFTWIQVDFATSINELAKKEKDYILDYKTKGKTLNSDAGGGFKKTVYQFSVKDGRLIAEYDSLGSAAASVNACDTCVGNASTGQAKTCKGYYWSYLPTFPTNFKDERKKQVVQFDLDGNYIAHYISVAEASRQTGCNKTSIAKVCRGERKSSSGYLWEYY